MKTRTVYKLFRKRKDGSLGPLFIGRKLRIPLLEWIEAENIPTKGYAVRPGWHCTEVPDAPHLSKTNERVWAECKIREGEYYVFRAKSVKRDWFIAKTLFVERIIYGEE